MATSTPDPDITVAAAQSASLAGDVRQNVRTHLRFCRLAADRGVRLLVFPELSLTGYELELAPHRVLRPDDDALKPLREFAVVSGMTVVAGAPVSGTASDLHIGALVFRSDGSVIAHTKVHVHASEMPPFRPGPGGSPLDVGGTAVALAICADASHPQHAARAVAAGARMYAASVMIEEDAYHRKTGLLQGYTREHRIPALMANYSGSTGGSVSAGGSAIWSADGALVAVASGREATLVIGSRIAGVWRGGEEPC